MLAEGRKFLRLDFESPERACATVHQIALGPLDWFSDKRTWEIDEKALKKARDFLGLTWPLEFTYHEDLSVLPLEFNPMQYMPGEVKRGITGKAVYKFHKKREHIINIFNGVSTDFASIGLWHELTHAKQCEEYENPKEWWKVIELNRCIWPGFNPITDYVKLAGEEEAYRNCVNHFDMYPLTKELSA